MSGNGNGKDDVWDEERLCEGLRRLDEMHNKLNSLRSIIPHMLSPLCPPHLSQFTNPAALFDTFSHRAVSASDDVLAFMQLWQTNSPIIEHANISRAKSREGIRQWALKDGMPPGVVVVGEEEGREEKGRENRRRKAEREVREKEREKRRRRSAAGGMSVNYIDEDVGEQEEGADEEEGNSKEKEEERRREREEVEESGREPRVVVEEFRERLENPGEGDTAARKWRGVTVEYIERPTASSSSSSTSFLAIPPSQIQSTSPQIKIILPSPTHLQFTIEINILPTQPPTYRYTLLQPPIAILPPSPTNTSSTNTSIPHHHLPHHAAQQPSSQQPHLHTSLLRAITSRPQPTQNNLRLLLEMVCGYTGLFTERCVGCGRLVYAGARAELPVVRRRGKSKGLGGAGVGEGEGEEEGKEGGRERKGGLEWLAWHEGCLERVGSSGAAAGK